MKLETEVHSGKCGHCKTDVPLDASVCAGCGATWGFSNGKNRQELYDDNIFGCKFGKFIFFVAIALITIGTFLVLISNGDDLGWGLIAGSIFVYLIFGYKGHLMCSQVKHAQHGEIGWWRNK